MNLKDLLTANSISCAHIVDDAFDTVPSDGASAQEAQALLDVIDDNTATKIADILGETLSDDEEIRRAVQLKQNIEKLYRRKAELGDQVAEALFRGFEVAQASKLAQVKPLVDLLEKSGVTCRCFGADYTVKGSDEPQLLFVDLRLKEVGAINHEDAVVVFRKLKSEHEQSKPFVFLMSSLSTILPNQREPFRRDADLFQSEFEGVDKGVFKNGDELSRMLASYIRAMPKLGALRTSMDKFEAAVGEATLNVVKELRALDLADYFVLFHNTTSIEKTTLGTYVVELLLEYLASEVEGTEDVWELPKALEELNLESLPRARFGLTAAAAKLYSSNMLHSPKRLLAEESLQRGPADGYFYLGDIFFGADWFNTAVPSTAYTIITPACDLVRPSELAGRSILLVEGAVTEVTPGSIPTSTTALPVVVMEHPRNKDKHLLIEWQRKKLHLWDDKARAAFKVDADPRCTFVRVGRLKPVYAVQLQHAVTTDIGRIGTQRPPSSLSPRTVKCFVSDGKTWLEIYKDDAVDAAALKDYEHDGAKYMLFILSDPAVHRSLVALEKWLANNGTVEKADLLQRIANGEFQDALQGFKHRVAAKPQRGDWDESAYPLSGKLGEGEDKLVAFVPGTRCSSPYNTIATGSKTKGRPARIIFRFEEGAGEPTGDDGDDPQGPESVKSKTAEEKTQPDSGALDGAAPAATAPTVAAAGAPAAVETPAVAGAPAAAAAPATDAAPAADGAPEASSESPSRVGD